MLIYKKSTSPGSEAIINFITQWTIRCLQFKITKEYVNTLGQREHTSTQYMMISIVYSKWYRGHTLTYIVWSITFFGGLKTVIHIQWTTLSIFISNKLKWLQKCLQSAACYKLISFVDGFRVNSYSVNF